MNDDRDLYLAFPQWQGAGTGTGLEEGARIIRRLLGAESRFVTVDVPLDDGAELPIVNDIKARSAIVSQLCAARRIIDSARPKRVLTVGGDCGVEIAPVAYLNRLYGRLLAVFWFDAHADLHTPQSSKSKNFHGMPLRHLLGEGDADLVEMARPALDPSQVFLCGVRSLDAAEADYLDLHPSVRRFGIEALRQRSSHLVDAFREPGFNYAYIHIDLDVLDPGEFPAVPCPTPSGLSIEDLHSVGIPLSRDCHVVGMSIVEHCGSLGRSKSAANRKIAEIVGIIRNMFDGG